MALKIAGGDDEDGVVIGNTYDKYGSNNPIVRELMRGFDAVLSDFVELTRPQTIHEIGCGEGYWVLRWLSQGLAARGCDFSERIISIAQENADASNLDSSVFSARSIYDLDAVQDSADLIVCCEVLEHLEHPKEALGALQKVTAQHLILSVPREPLWCALNLARGKYITSWGNTPGHLQHWSKQGFIKFVSAYFEVTEIRSPIPWTMVLCRPKR